MAAGNAVRRIALFGPPGAGKGTQARLLVERYDLRHISTGRILRRAVKTGSPLAEEAQSYMDRGLLVPDALVRSLAEDAITEIGFADFLLDGYPRTIMQANWLTTFLAKADSPLSAVLNLKLSEADIIARLSRRRVDPHTGENFHLDHKPPPAHLLPSLIQRPDDTPDAIQKRISVYVRDTAPVAWYYRNAGLLRDIDAAGSFDHVHMRICAALQLD